jgi:L-iditol 2-dehydrogenase
MKVAVMTDIGRIGFTERPVPSPRPGEALIKLEYVGICGSDLHYFESGRIGNRIVKPPFVLGHEAGGVVAEVGEGVSHLKAGDRVALEPGKTCGRCVFCRTGMYNLCPDVRFFASPPIDGVFSEYAAHEAALCFPLPDNVTTMEGALIEPLSVGFHAARQGGAQAGMSALVTGAGCIGLVSLLALRAMGVSKVYVTDIEQKRLGKAIALGAADVVNARERDPVDAVMSLTGGLGCDIVIEAAGTEVTTAQAVQIARRGGTVVCVGQSAGGSVNVPMTVAIMKELTFKTVFRYRHIYPIAIEAVASGAVNIKDVVTNVFAFDEIQSAFEQSLHNKADIVKSVIKISGD